MACVAREMDVPRVRAQVRGGVREGGAVLRDRRADDLLARVQAQGGYTEPKEHSATAPHTLSSA